MCWLWQRFVLIFATFRVLYDMAVVDSCKLYEGLIAFSLSCVSAFSFLRFSFLFLAFQLSLSCVSVFSYLRSTFSFLRSAFSFFFKALRSCLLRVTSSSLSISIVLNWN